MQEFLVSAVCGFVNGNYHHRHIVGSFKKIRFSNTTRYPKRDWTSGNFIHWGIFGLYIMDLPGNKSLRSSHRRHTAD